MIKDEAHKAERSEKVVKESKFKIKLDLNSIGNKETQKLNDDNADFDEQARQEFAKKDDEINEILNEINVVLDNLNYAAENISQVIY